MNGNGDLVRSLMGDGDLSDPSEKFLFEPTTGMYREIIDPSHSSFTFVKKGAKRIRITEDEVDVPGVFQADSIIYTTAMASSIALGDGDVADPSLTYTSDTKTGLYKKAAKTVAVTCNGSDSASFSDSLVSFYKTVTSGTYSLGCGNLSCLSIFSTGSATISGGVGCGSIVSTGSLTCTGSIGSSGSISCGTNPVSCGTITSSGSISCGTNPLSCGAITSSGAFNNASNTLTTGDITCGRITASGIISEPLFSITATRPSSAPQAISNNSITKIQFINANPVNNFSFSINQTDFTIPQNGWYVFTFETSFDTSSLNFRVMWGNFALVGGGSLALGQTCVNATTGAQTRMHGSCQRQCLVNDVFSVQIYQNSGLTLNISNDSFALTTLSIKWLGP